MDSEAISPFLRAQLDALAPAARILDVGGWFKPLCRATHVVDIMPYQTRRGRLQLEPADSEGFRAESWFQADFLNPKFRLPVPDKFFAFVYCGQTIEDLTDPEPLLREMSRVAHAGVIESPSRLVEQTTGVRDRITSLAGHPHHHWIIDVHSDQIELCPKSALAPLPDRRWMVPLLTFERRIASDEAAGHNCHFAWSDELRWTVIAPGESRQRACAFRASAGISRSDFWRDPVIRRLRGLKSRLLHRRRDDPTAWFQEMLRLSAPFQQQSSSRHP